MANKVLVTGGAGFIGSHLVDRLLEEDFDVTVLDNFTNGRRENIAHLEGRKHFVYYNGDINDERLVRKLVSGKDIIFHLAAHANIQNSMNDHAVDLENNLMGTLNIVEAMVREGVNDLVFASTSAVYGEALVRPTTEDCSCIQTSLYGASKYACEGFVEAYTQFTTINFWAFRFANVIGERFRRGVIWDFVRKLKENPSELEILGNGQQSKEYFYVKDCVDGILTGYRKSRNRVNIFNLGIDEQTTVDKVADLVIGELALENVKRKYSGGPRGWIGDNPIVELSIEKIKKLGWRPKLSSEQAIKLTCKWDMLEMSYPISERTQIRG